MPHLRTKPEIVYGTVLRSRIFPEYLYLFLGLDRRLHADAVRMMLLTRAGTPGYDVGFVSRTSLHVIETDYEVVE